MPAMVHRRGGVSPSAHCSVPARAGYPAEGSHASAAPRAGEVAMSAARQTDVLVVGAGRTGLVAALSLAKAGLSVEVIDEAWRQAGHSYALALHPRSLNLLDELGVASQATDSGRKLPSLTLLGGEEPRQSLRCGARDDRFPYLLSLPQSGLERLLTDALARLGVKVRWSHRLASLEPNGDAGVAA